MTADGRGAFVWDNWELIDRILAQALGLEPLERGRYLAEACSGRPHLLAVVEELVEQSERDDSTLDTDFGLLAGSTLVGPDREAGGLRPGQIVGRYCIVREIDRGGMATVYEAARSDGVFRRRVALKILRRGLDTDDLIRRFHAEREILSSLVHPNIARILDGGSTGDGRPYLVMELVDGQPLADFVESGELDLGRRLDLFLEVAEAVRFAHGRLVIHRDIKPANVLVDSEGHAKLLDFGIAKILAPDGGATALTRHAPMTPAYASPEQTRGERMTTASDVFQLGILLFELATGSRVDEDDANRRVALGSALDADLETIIDKAMREEPDERYASAEAFIADIRRYREGRPIAARPPSWGYRLRKFVRRNRWVVRTAALAVFLTLGYAAMLTVQADRLARERDRARRLAERAGALRSLLVGQFGAANPWGSYPDAGRDVTVAEALETAVALARQELGGQPLVLAGILSDVASIDENLDRRRRAMELLEEAMGLREAAGHGRSEEQLDDMGLLSSIAAGESLADSARSLAERRLRLESAAPHPDGERVGIAIAQLARLEVGSGRFDRADSLFQESLAMLRSARGDPAVLASQLESRSDAQMGLGELAAAEASVREALSIRRRLVDDRHPTIAVAEAHLAEVYHRAGRLEESADLFRTALGKMEASLGEEHSTTLSTLNNFGLVLDALEDFDGAVEIHRQLLERSLARSDSKPSHEVAISMQNLAAALVRRGSLAEADSLAERAGRMFGAADGPGHYTVGFTLLTRAQIALLRGEGRRAVELASEAEELLRDALPPGHYAHAVATCRRAGGLALTGRLVAAEPLARASFETLKASAAASARRVGECGRILDDISERLARPDHTG